MLPIVCVILILAGAFIVTRRAAKNDEKRDDPTPEYKPKTRTVEPTDPCENEEEWRKYLISAITENKN